MRYLLKTLPLILFLSACSAPHHPAATASPSPPKGEFLLDATHQHAPLSGDFASNPLTIKFIDRIVAEQGFDRQQLHDVLAQAQKLDWVIRLMDKQAPTLQPESGPNGAWIRYRNKFITPENVQNGVIFWNQYQDALVRAQQTYGVPAEIIVGIIGVETRWGKIMGKTRIIDALATLSFDYPRRADFFTAELETFLLMARKEGKDPLSLQGSYAGAMGYGQFMPSSFKNYAVDFNHDGHINLWDPVDAIGSIANYFSVHGWVKGGTVAIMASGKNRSLQTGFKTRYRVSQLAKAGFSPTVKLDPEQQVSLLRFDMGKQYQYWYGLPNFYAITRYNHSNHYAMAVWQLGLAVREAR
ncbi:MAG: Membrane-bound lytic murein transglycosylase B [Candidatus Erwinia impunctatus]|nr:Membrane-bound lytic murein transglycosylase B [Culicoides impunctatus]